MAARIAALDFLKKSNPPGAIFEAPPGIIELNVTDEGWANGTRTSKDAIFNYATQYHSYAIAGLYFYGGVTKPEEFFPYILRDPKKPNEKTYLKDYPDESLQKAAWMSLASFNESILLLAILSRNAKLREGNVISYFKKQGIDITPSDKALGFIQWFGRNLGAITSTEMGPLIDQAKTDTWLRYRLTLSSTAHLIKRFMDSAPEMADVFVSGDDEARINDVIADPLDLRSAQDISQTAKLGAWIYFSTNNVDLSDWQQGSRAYDEAPRALVAAITKIMKGYNDALLTAVEDKNLTTTDGAIAEMKAALGRK